MLKNSMIAKVMVFLTIYTVAFMALFISKSVKIYSQRQFKRGVFVKPYALGCTFRANYLDECRQDTSVMLKKAKDLGVSWVKINAEVNPGINQMIIEETEKVGLK